MTENLQPWKLTYDKRALEPARKMYCPICANAEPALKVELVMRRSRIHTVADVRVAGREKGVLTRPYACDIAFKCPHCDFYCIFGVPLDMAYAQKCIEMREGSIDFVLPEETWNEEGQVKERLAKLGYW